MRLGLSFGYMHRDPSQLIQMAKGAEALGYHSIWTSEAYGYDAVTPLIWMAAHTRRVQLGTAIMQMPARSPAMTAMTAASADFLSGGRFVLGLGVSAGSFPGLSLTDHRTVAKSVVPRSLTFISPVISRIN